MEDKRAKLYQHIKEQHERAKERREFTRSLGNSTITLTEQEVFSRPPEQEIHSRKPRIALGKSQH